LTLYQELKRRNVFRVGAAYVVTAWLLIQVAETVFPLFGYDDTPARIVVVVLAIGFIPSLIFAWVFELTPEGLKKDHDVDSALFSHRNAKLHSISNRKLNWTKPAK
jgi:adenylate cyclase